MCLLLTFSATVNGAPHEGAPAVSQNLWAHENLVASGLDVANPQSAEERAKMLQTLGLKRVTLGGPSDNVAIDAQIEAMQRHGITVFGWFVDDTDTPALGVDWKGHIIDASDHGTFPLGALLEAFKRHGVKPQLWFARNMRYAKSAKPATKPFAELTVDEKNQEFRKLLNYDPTPPQERASRIRQEVQHLKALMELAASYGIEVALYKHGGWLSVEDNAVDVIEGLKAEGVHNVGIVYRFIHAHDEVDDTADFAAVWRKIQRYVWVVDITGLHAERTTVFPILYPSQGDLEVKMMRIMQDSGWRGTIGVSAERAAEVGGDAQAHLRNNLIGLDWISAELNRPDSGGVRPLGHYAK